MRIVTGSTTIAANTTSVQVALSPSVINNRTLVVFSVNGGNNNPNQSMVIYDLAGDGSSITFLRQAVGTNAITIHYQLIESLIWNVQRYSGTWTTNNVTINLTTPIDVNRSFPIYYMFSDGGTYSSDECFRLTLNANTIQAVSQNTGAINTTYRIQVVSASGSAFAVTPGSFSQAGAGNFSNVIIPNYTFNFNRTTAVISSNAGNSNTTRIGEKMQRIFFNDAAKELRVGREQNTTIVNANYFIIEFMEGIEVSHSNEFLINAGVLAPGSTFSWARPLSNTWHLHLSANNFMVISTMTADDHLGSVQMLAALSGNSSNTTATYSRTNSAGNARWNADFIYFPDTIESPQWTGNNSNYTEIGIKSTSNLNVDLENSQTTEIKLGDSLKLDPQSENSNRTDTNIRVLSAVELEQDNSTETTIGVMSGYGTGIIIENNSTTLIDAGATRVELSLTFETSNQTINNVRLYDEIEWQSDNSTLLNPNIREVLNLGGFTSRTDSSDEWSLNPENTNNLTLNNRHRTDLNISQALPLSLTSDSTNRSEFNIDLEVELELEIDNDISTAITLRSLRNIDLISDSYQGLDLGLSLKSLLAPSSENSQRSNFDVKTQSIFDLTSVQANQSLFNINLFRSPDQVISQSSSATLVDVSVDGRPKPKIIKVEIKDKNPIIKVTVDVKTL